MGHSSKKLSRTNKTAPKAIRKRRRTSDKTAGNVEPKKRVSSHLAAMCAIRITSKALRKTIRTLCEEFRHAENPDHALIEVLSPLIAKGLQNGKAKMTYASVYTPNVKYYAIVGDDGVHAKGNVTR